jgi:tryptophan-rich sensory protein
MLARYASLAAFLALVVAASWLAGGFEAGDWYYRDLGKPSWTPAPWFLAGAWALAYLIAALAAWQVWLSGHYNRLGALTWWAMLLVLNVAWHGLFFGLHRIGWAWLELGITLGVAVLCVRAFLPLSRQAGRLMLAYLAWITFLWLLSGAMWTINGGFLSRFLQL